MNSHSLPATLLAVAMLGTTLAPSSGHAAVIECEGKIYDLADIESAEPDRTEQLLQSYPSIRDALAPHAEAETRMVEVCRRTYLHHRIPAAAPEQCHETFIDVSPSVLASATAEAVTIVCLATTGNPCTGSCNPVLTPPSCMCSTGSGDCSATFSTVQIDLITDFLGSDIAFDSGIGITLAETAAGRVGVAVDAGYLSDGFTVPVSLTTSATLTPPAVRFDLSNASGAIGFGTTTMAPLAGPMAMPGSLRLCFVASCTSPASPVALTMNGTRGIGLGGTISSSVSGLTVMIQGGQWTSGSAVVTTPMGAASTAVGSNTTSALTLISPVMIRTGLAPNPLVSGFARISVTVIPEPGVGLMLLSGAIACGALGHRRRHHR